MPYGTRAPPRVPLLVNASTGGGKSVTLRCIACQMLHHGSFVFVLDTKLAQALGHLAVRQGAHLRFAKTSRILADLAGGRADRTWDKRIRELVWPDVCSSSTTSPCASSERPRLTTYTSWSASGRGGP
ncbi:hypothetical protein [Streptomyces sp. NPDC048269]|uniref:hypothetical protein n=1 Tax=Streptomyces sp. NPDC048269 TaxID=3155753 RepID=UPI00341C3CB1